MERNKINNLRPGSKHYMAYVGPPKKYEAVGKMQFDFLIAAGLQKDSKLLDIGCGSLRAGLHFIPYLNEACYFGLEPNKWLVDEGIKQNLTESIVNEKQPLFEYNSNFDLSGFNSNFDFVIAQSIFSHASQSQIKQCLSEVNSTLNKNGLFLATFVLGKANYEGDEWVYPACVRYTESHIKKMIEETGLKCLKSNWPQGVGQTWFVIYKEGNQLAESVANIKT